MFLLLCEGAQANVGQQFLNAEGIQATDWTEHPADGTSGTSGTVASATSTLHYTPSRI